MKKIFLTILVVFLGLSVNAEVIQGGVSFDVNTARQYVQEGIDENPNVTGPYELQAGNVNKVVYSRNPMGNIIGITVQYKGDACNAYIYNAQNKLIYIDKYDKATYLYPHRGYRYNLQGELILTSLTVSKDEMFRFDPDGNLIAHSVKGIIYDENGKIIGSGK